ncbi:MAG: TOBE domain-containing protein [Gammaproteobacteria bacterium]
MKASARNQFFGTIGDITIGAVNAEVQILLKGGATIVAAVSKESIESLGIRSGCEAVALVKAPQIVIATDLGGYRLSARNQLHGTVTRIHKGAVNSEVIIALTGGESIAATVTNESIGTLQLQEGNTATAIFKAGAVILGIKR